MTETPDDYFIIRCSEDGATVEAVDRDTLLSRVASGYYGTQETFRSVPNRDPNYWGDGLLVIKGHVVQPKPVQVVTEFDVE